MPGHVDTASPPTQPPPSLVLPLRRLRRRLARWFWLDGFVRVASTTAALALIDFGLDRWLRLDRPQRIVMLVLMAAAILVTLYRRLIRPLSARISDDAICRQVERIDRSQGQRLISALQLARDPAWERLGISPGLARATIAEGVAAAQTIDWRRLLDVRRERYNLGLLAGLLLLAIGVGAAAGTSSTPSIWWRRNVLLADDAWPQSVYLIVEGLQDGRLRAARGAPRTIRVSVDPRSERTPDSVVLEFRPARGRSTLLMRPTPDAAFEASLQRLLDPFELRAVGGDERTAWIPVELVAPPALDDLQLTVEPPSYTGLPAKTLAAAGPLTVPEGGRVTLSGRADKRIGRADLIWEGRRWPARIGDGPTPDVVWTPPPDELGSGRYTIHLADAEGLAQDPPTTFVLQLSPDRPPQVDAALVGVGGSALPTARLPLALRLRDDYAVAAARLRWRVRNDVLADDESSAVSRDESLDESLDRADVGAARSALAPASAAPPVRTDAARSVGASAAETPTSVAPLAGFAPGSGKAEWAWTDQFDLQPLGLRPGVTLAFYVEADDADPVDGPNQGRSSELLVRIVSAEELRADWMRREREQRQELEQLQRNQDELQVDARALAKAEDLTPADRTALTGLAQRQKQLARQYASVARRLDAIADEVVNNRAESTPDRPADRLRRELVAPLDDLADQTAVEAVRSLDQASRTVDDPTARRRALEAAATLQQQVSDRLAELLARMLKAEGYQEAVRLVYEIQKAQQEVLDRTQREKQRRIDAILGEAPADRAGRAAPPAPAPQEAPR